MLTIVVLGRRDLAVPLTRPSRLPDKPGTTALATAAITPDGKAACVANTHGDPIDTATNIVGKVITVRDDPTAIAITPNGDSRMRRIRPLGHGDPD